MDSLDLTTTEIHMKMPSEIELNKIKEMHHKIVYLLDQEKLSLELSFMVIDSLAEGIKETLEMQGKIAEIRYLKK